MDEDTHRATAAPQAENGAVPPPGTTPQTQSAWGPLALIYTIGAGAVIACAAVGFQATAWGAAQLEVAFESPTNPWFGPGMAALGAFVVALAAAPMLFMRRFVRIRAASIAWLAAAAVMAIFGLTRLIPVSVGAFQLLVQAAGCALVAAAVWTLTAKSRRLIRDEDPPRAPGAFWWAACAGGFTILPWTWTGAFGSFWDTVVAGVCAMAFAAMMAFVLGDTFWRPFVAASQAVRIWAGGAAAGVALVIAGSAVGGQGIQWPIQILLGALGFAIAALQQRDFHTGRVVAAAVAPAVFGPLAFTDADEFMPLVFGPEFGKWLLLALAIAVPIAWIMGLIMGLANGKVTAVPAVGAGLAVVLVGTIGGINAFAQPGLHGEKLLVVMEEQADLSGITGDRDARLTEVHERLTETADSTQGPLREDLDSWGVDWRPFYLINAIEVDLDLLARGWLQGREDVSTVLLNPQARPVPSPAGVTTGTPLDREEPQANIAQINAPQAWEAGATGEGITIGIADSGVDGEHPALAERFRGGDDSWADPVNGTTEPTDTDGHGTHALGLALGDEGVGAAPGADWMGCSNLPRNFGNPADYLACMQFMLAPYPQDGDPMADGDPARAPHIVTNSWGCPSIEGCTAEVLEPAVEAFQTAGVFFVAAAGNSGPGCDTAGSPPANYPATYSVGAVNADNVVTDFSSRGDGQRLAKPDIAAPGNEVVSTLPGGGFGPMTGTSMAAPQVAGAVAVLWSAQPELVGDIAATRDVLNETASEVDKANGSELDACGVSAAGAGVVNVGEAVDSLN